MKTDFSKLKYHDPQLRAQAIELIKQRNEEMRQVKALLEKAQAISNQWPKSLYFGVGAMMNGVQSSLAEANGLLDLALADAEERENNETYIGNLAARDCEL